MLNYFLTKENLFSSYNTEHLVAFVLFAVICVMSIGIGKYLSYRRQTILGAVLALVTLWAVLMRMWISYYIGEFDMQEHLPLYLCRVIPFFIPFTMWYRHQYSFGILYFWVLAGTLNAVITPDLHYASPYFDTLFSWILHFGLIITILYGVFVYKLRPYWIDLRRAIVAGAIYVIVVHMINITLQSNYSYTMHKPPNGSIMDALGPWPIYLFALFFVGILLFLIIYIPFYIHDYRNKHVHHRADKGTRT